MSPHIFKYEFKVNLKTGRVGLVWAYKVSKATATSPRGERVS